MPAPSGRLTAVAVDPTGVQVMIAGGNNRQGTAVVRDLRSGEPLERLAVPGGVPPFVRRLLGRRATARDWRGRTGP